MSLVSLLSWTRLLALTRRNFSFLFLVTSCWGCLQLMLLASFAPSQKSLSFLSSEHDVIGLVRMKHNVAESHLSPKRSTVFEFEILTNDAPICKTLKQDDISFTLATQLSDNRIWLMNHHCTRWKSGISLAILTDRTRESIQDELDSMGCRNVTLQILPQKDYKSVDYPVNALRNLAISGIQTSHFLFIDADFWLSHGMDQILMKKIVRQRLAEDYKQALVIPAYMLRYVCKRSHKDPSSCHKEKVSLMPKDKADLIAKMNDGIVTTFDFKNPGGHGTTRYDLWEAQRTGSIEDIPCSKSLRYEPYLVVQRCRDLPPFQEKFTGYGMNKIAWILHLRRMGYLFSQIGGAFLVHYPHPESDARKLWMKKSGVGREKVDSIFDAFQSWLQTFPDDQRFQDCPDSLPNSTGLID